MLKSLDNPFARETSNVQDAQVVDLALSPDELESIADLSDEDFVLIALDLENSKLVEMGICNRSPKTNWVERRGGLGDKLNGIVRHLVEKGMSCGHAIAVAINAVKKGGATGDLNWKGVQHMNGKSQAEYAAAAAHWEALKGGAG